MGECVIGDGVVLHLFSFAYTPSISQAGRTLCAKQDENRDGVVLHLFRISNKFGNL